MFHPKIQRKQRIILTWKQYTLQIFDKKMYHIFVPFICLTLYSWAHLSTKFFFFNSVFINFVIDPQWTIQNMKLYTIKEYNFTNFTYL